jgi:hypothetical protein
MGLLRRWRERRRESKAEARAMAQMRRADDVQAPEPKEAKLSQMRD